MTDVPQLSQMQQECLYINF